MLHKLILTLFQRPNYLRRLHELSDSACSFSMRHGALNAARCEEFDSLQSVLYLDCIVVQLMEEFCQ